MLVAVVDEPGEKNGKMRLERSMSETRQRVVPRPALRLLAFFLLTLVAAGLSGAATRSIARADPSPQPTISTQATAGPVAVGTSIGDSATLAGTTDGSNGSLTFNAYTDSACTNAVPAASSTVAVSGDGNYAAAGFTPLAPGTYYWTASYTSDDATQAVVEGCLGSNESTVVTPTAWTGSGSATEVGTNSVVDNGTDFGSPQFTYNVPNACSCGVSGNWTFQTTTAVGGTVTLPYTYTGFNAYFNVKVGLVAFVTDSETGTTTTLLVNAGPADCCTTPSAGFSYSGTATLSVNAGDTYGFMISGSNFDSNATLQGTLTVNIAGATTIATTATPSVSLGTTISDSATLGGLTASSGGTVAFNAYAVAGCTTSPIYSATVPVNGATGNTYAAPGFTPAEPGTYYWTASYSGDTGTQAVTEACGGANESSAVTGPSNDAWTRAQLITLDGTGAGTAVGSLDLSGQARWYKIPVTPGGTVQVDLTGLPANYDLAVFSDISQAFSALTNTASLQTLTAETGNDAFSPSVFSPSVFSPSVFSPSVFSPSVFSPSVFSPSVFSPSVFSPSVFSPSVFSPSVFSPSVFSPSSYMPTNANPDPTAYTGAQVRSLIAISANDGTASEHAFADIWNNTGFFYIRVNGRNGTYDPGAAFNLAVHENTGTCPSTVQPSGLQLLSTPAPASNLQTLILADYPRMTDDGQLAAMEQKLTTFAGKVGGAVLNVSQLSPQVAALNTQADNNPGCVYAKNLVASAIRDVVTAYRATNPNVKYIVIVGDDHAIPFFRYPDTAGIGPESDYSPPVLDTTASQASLQSNDVLSQDAYGSTNVIHLKGVDLPVPGLPVGRLVKTPTEIIGLLNAYLGLTNGVVATPTSSLVTGYDFMAQEANSIEGDLSAGLGGATGVTKDTLITPEGAAPSASWTAAQLQTMLLGKRHDLIFLGGHFSANNTLAADNTTTLNATAVANSTVNLTNSIVFSQGCHSGYSIVNGDAVPNVTQTLDWTEAFAQKGATLIAGTGYQYGDTNFLAYSGQLYADFAHALRLGTGPVAVGSALVQAKDTYLANTPNLQGIDIKSLLESTLYGLPMLSVNMPTGRIAQASSSTPITPTGVSGAPGNQLGLTSADLTVTPTLGTVTTPLTDQNGNPIVTATYLTGPAGVSTIPGAPTLPLSVTNVGAADTVLRGVGFLAGTYSDQSPITPLTGAPATEVNGVHSPFVSSAFWPSRLWTVNYFGGLTGGPASTLLDLTPAQYKSDASGNQTDIQRTFSSVGVRLFYSDNTTTYTQSGGAPGATSTPALAAPPTISRVDATSTPTSAGDTVNFNLHVVGDPSAGIQQVWVTYAGVVDNRWVSLFLTQDPTDSTLWTGSLTGLSDAAVNGMQFIVQAVNGVGLVSLDDNQGGYYQPNQIPPALQTGTAGLAATSLQLNSPPSGVYGSSAPVSATLTASGQAVSGESVSFTIGGSTQTATTDSNGLASVQLPLIDSPSSTAYQLTAGFAGDATRAGSSASTAFTISELPTTLALTSGSAAVLTGADTGVSATLKNGQVGLPQKTVAFVLTPAGGGTAIVQTRITNSGGKASLGVVGQLVPGTYSVTAFFGGTPIPHVTLPADPVYLSSSSSPAATLTEKANPLSSGTTTCNGFFSGTGAQVTVPAGAVCTLVAGTKVTGNVTVSAGGAFVDQGATISGNLQATNALAFTVAGGGTIGGNVQVTGLTSAPAGSDNSLCNTKVSGNVQVTSNSAASPFDIGNVGACAGGAAVTINGNLQATSNAGKLQIAGNTVNGNLQATSNAGNLQIAGNTAKGNIQVTSNTGGGALTSNSASGNCQLSGDHPVIVATSNTAKGTNSCKVSA